MGRWLYVLLLAVPVAVVARANQWPPLAIFGLATLGLIPLSGLIGQSTEALAERIGPRLGGLLNATFGNAAEIIIGLTGIAAGLLDVVRASLAGSIIGNTLLVLGTAMLAGGWRHGQQRFDARTAGQYASMLMLAVVGLALPTLLATIGEGNKPGTGLIGGQSLHTVSYGTAVILLLCYGAYIAYSVFGVHTQPTSERRAVARQRAMRASGAAERGARRAEGEPPKRPAGSARATLGARLRYAWEHTLWLPIAALAGVTALTAVTSEALVGAIEPVAHEVGLNPFFVGLIILPIAGNAAEHFTAITTAVANHMETTMAITAGSSIQIALLAAPLLVLASPLLGHPLDLNFSLLEVGVFALAAALFALISLDGESNWLEGLLLLAFYLILAVGTFVAPA